MKVRLLPGIPTDVQLWLVRAGLEADDDAQIALAWLVGGERPTTEDAGAGAVVGLVERPDQVAAALSAGALDVIVGQPSIEELMARLASHDRTARAWQRRLAAQQRRANRAMTELASTQDLLGRLIDATPNPVMAVDVRGRVLVFNRAAEQALGYEADYARKNMHVTDIYANAADARRVLAEIRATRSGLVQGLGVRLRARWGEQIPVELSAAEVNDADGSLIATVGVFQDMREQVALRNRLEATTEQLIAAEQRAAAIELAGQAAYEINQPLTALMGTLELLEMDPGLSDRARSRLERAQGHLARIRDAVRALARNSRPRATGAEGNRMSELTRDHD